MAGTKRDTQTSPKCTCCGGKLDSYVTKSELYKTIGQLPFCKNCVDDEYEKLLKRFNYNVDKAIYYLCLQLDMPFYMSVLNGAKQESEKKNGKLNRVYITKINSFRDKNNYGDSFLDGEFNLIINDYEENNKESTSQDNDLILFWGKGYTLDEYNFMQEYYDELIKIYDHSLPVQINNYRNMAKTQLQANKCLEKCDIGGYEKSMKILSMLSGDSNIKPNQETSVGNLTKGGYDVFLKHIEDDEPILDWEKDLGHIDRLKSMLNIFFFGHFAKVLNIPNPWKSKYDEEMKQYTVEDEEIEEEKTQVNFLGDM